MENSQWMEKVMSKTYDRLKKVDKNYELTVEDKTYVLKQYKKSGPAFTIYVQPKDESEADHIMNVDLVPCLEFEDITLDGYKQISNMTNNIIIVAKPSNEPDGHHLWRLSFYEQEKKMLQENEAGKLKPIIRLIKKLRDKLEWKKLASYYIETLCLHELDARKAENDIQFFRAPKASLFIYMLEKLREAISLKKLPYFWHEKYNLFANMTDKMTENYANRLKSILNLIHKNISINRFIIAEQMLSDSEVSALRAIGNAENVADLTTSMEDLDISGSQKADISEVESIDVMNSSETSNAEFDTFDSPNQDIGNTAAEPTTIKSRIEFICKELTALSNLKNEIFEEEKEKLRKSCMSLYITLSTRK
ncbi:hypothetical protein TSAR_010307 [Trichomalopsis sarcophagae]|uniref:Uncharacterized protein n=1 Tax=Trichomalopsis sarcophagae TaxID=543379 RepID=A0A232EPR0_9HYME|nr:hypothetical protein TSAR_010307 [Trichomalopsis sarcophagae]